ncbi:hypothetical protein C8Q74DRAFT_990674 [Fomes fomentarius]|nr:hypothetical protein C8Q74DRAFT_990674 [Fomes fomentarius]
MSVSGWLFHPTRPPDRFWGPGSVSVLSVLSVSTSGLRCASRAHSPQLPPAFNHTPCRRPQDESHWQRNQIRYVPSTHPLAHRPRLTSRYPSSPRRHVHEVAGRGLRQTRGRRCHTGFELD